MPPTLKFSFAMEDIGLLEVRKKHRICQAPLIKKGKAAILFEGFHSGQGVGNGDMFGFQFFLIMRFTVICDIVDMYGDVFGELCCCRISNSIRYSGRSFGLQPSVLAEPAKQGRFEKEKGIERAMRTRVRGEARRGSRSREE